jgi:hypothetical protein
MPIVTALGDLSDITPIVEASVECAGRAPQMRPVQAVESEWHEQHL